MTNPVKQLVRNEPWNQSARLVDSNHVHYKCWSVVYTGVWRAAEIIPARVGNIVEDELRSFFFF